MSKTSWIQIILFDFALTAAFLLAQTFTANATKTQPLSHASFETSLFLFIVILLASYLLLWFSRQKKITFVEIPTKHSASKIWQAHFFLLILSWGICFLAYYPGVGMNDGLNVLAGRLSSANQFPIWYCVYVVLLGKIGSLFGSLQYAVALYSVMQLLVTASISACILTFVWCHSSSRIIHLLSSAYYLLQPVLAIYSISMLKDTVFSSLLVLYGILLFSLCTREASAESARNRRKAQLMFLLSSLLLSALRSNGVYVVVVCLAFFFFSGRSQKKLALITACLTVFFNFSGSLIMNHYDVRHNISETFGIPIQQVSAVIAENGVISEDEETTLRHFIDPEDIRVLYNPGNADPIKWSDSFNRKYLNGHAGEFLSLWASLLPHNFSIYVRAYLQETYWFWAPVQSGGIQMFSTIEEIADNTWLADFIQQNGIHDAPILQGPVRECLHAFYQIGSFFLREGVCFWLMLFSMVLARCRGWKWKNLLSFYLPQLLTWMTIMVSTPINNSFRYVLFYAYALPVYLLFLTHNKPAAG